MQRKELKTGTPIETYVRKVVYEDEDVPQVAPMIYTEKTQGILAGYNIRTDRFEVALNAIRNGEVEDARKLAQNTTKEPEKSNQTDEVDVDTSEEK